MLLDRMLASLNKKKLIRLEVDSWEWRTVARELGEDAAL